MNNPYEILGVSPYADDQEIAKAYKELAKKYHPDNYVDSPLAGMATQKMQEINQAYDTIRQQRKENISKRTADYPYSYEQNSRSDYHDVRILIKNGRIADADQILSGVPLPERNAEWYFLKGTILYRKGWTEQAFQHFQQAVILDPSNGEYQGALQMMNAERNGNYGGYQYEQNPMNSSCSACDICTVLCCADTCCECMGGDLICCC